MPSDLSDKAFDALLPPYTRKRSRQFWTPVAVAQRAAKMLHEHRATKILDVGCGPGKFCIAAGLSQPDLEVYGVEQRPRLVEIGVTLARTLGAGNVHLSVGDATTVSWEGFDGFYFYNPFSESLCPSHGRFDEHVAHSAHRFSSELLRVESLLARARVGTVVTTYHGLGGVIPASYELVADARAGSDRVRAWVQGRPRARKWVWLETVSDVIRVPQADARAALASLLCGDALPD